MIRFDQTLLDPDAEQLDAALRQAVEFVGSPSETIPGGLARIASEPEGSDFWGEPSGHAVHLVWWSDVIHRRHVRITATTSQPEPTGPPLLRVYPEVGFLVDGDLPAAILVVCPCGAVGRPEEIGWMGRECGPCHDRRAAGVLPARPWDVPTREFRGGNGDQLLPVFSPDGTRLLVDDGSAQHEWDLATARQIPFQHPAGRILAWSADGTLLAAHHDRRIRILQADILHEERSFDLSSAAWFAEFSPSGRLFLFIDLDTLQVWDRHSPRTDPILNVSGLGVPSWALSPDEQTLYLAEWADDVRVFPLGPGEPRRLTDPSPDAEDAARGSRAAGLYPIPDGRSLVVNARVLFRVHDLETGGILRESLLPAFARPGFPTPLLAGGRVLLATDSQSRTLNFLTLPELTNPVTLTPLDGPNGACCAWNDHWLAVADGARVRLIPWPPLLAWYLREGPQ
jgi:hypothetical protein